MKVYIGYDPREDDAYKVAESSLLRHSPTSSAIPIVLEDCQNMGLYTRPFEYRNNKPYDPISQAPMSTQFALSRFLIPWLHTGPEQWVLFIDVDMLFRCDVDELMQYADDRYAVMCVKHDVNHGKGVKMDGCRQTQYDRKNWSSVMLWNTTHQANTRLTIDCVNSRRGLWLHGLSWLKDGEIGALPKEFNHLVGLSEPNPEARIVHYTLGTPDLPGYEQCEFSKEWFDEYNRMEG